MSSLVTVYLMCTLCLAVTLEAVTARNSSEKVADCEIRFEDSGACACSSHDTAGPVTRYCNSDKFIKIQPCYCMYYDPTQNLSIVGHCYYSCYQYDGTVIEINGSAGFNADICDTYGEFQDHNTQKHRRSRRLNRKGQFCGQCNNSFGLAAYSYKMFSCISCEYYSYKNWLRYFAVALLPLTVFYILAVLLSFNVTSSSLNGIVLVIQCMMSPQQLYIFEGSPDLANMTVLLKIVSTILCTVNLDFFRLVYPPFCLHPEASVFQILSLDYIVALYPFLLIFMTYVLVTAYDKQYRLVVWMWRPIQRCVHRHRNTWDIRTSLIEIFATFILFSYVKILGVSAQILAFTATYDVAGNNLQHYYTHYNGTMKYFGSAHLPYALLAIGISSVFVVLPFLLLAVYPCRCFHKCLNYCGLRYQTLHVFMDAFQGSYRIQPRDLRYFSAFYLLLRILLLAQPHIFPSALFFFTSGILFLLTAAAVAIFQPYKVKTHNTIDLLLMLLMGIYFVSYYIYTQNYEVRNLAVFLQLVCIGFLMLYFISLLVWKLLGGKLQSVLVKAKTVLKSTVHRHREDNREAEGLESFDRESYLPLLRDERNLH